MDILNLYNKFIECQQHMCTDTRKIIPGALFFAWKGEHHNGNEYAAKALELGCKYAVIDDPQYAQDNRYIVVEDTIKTIQTLANYHRKQFRIPIVAIGGSNGKTTTKELCAAILGSQKQVIASYKSENNHIGVPKTLLGMTADTDLVVLEMGANHLGEIKTLCEIAEPTHGLVTNIGRDHLGMFGGEAAVIESNLELYEFLKKSQGHVFVNKHDEQLMKYAQDIEYTCYGEGLQNEFGVHSLATLPLVSFTWKQQTVKTQFVGEYNIQNCIAAIAVGVYFNVTDENIIKGIESYSPSNNRSEFFESETGNRIVKDYYNANVSSMELALDNFARLVKESDQASIVILGDMLDLGEYEDQEHQRVVQYVQKFQFDHVYLIGERFKKTEYPESCMTFSDVDQAISYFDNHTPRSSTIFLKASNGTNFQKLFDKVNW